MGGTRKIPHSCHRKRRGASFCRALLLRLLSNIPVCDFLFTMSVMHSCFRFAAFISLRIYFTIVCEDLAN